MYLMLTEGVLPALGPHCHNIIGVIIIPLGLCIARGVDLARPRGTLARERPALPVRAHDGQRVPGATGLGALWQARQGRAVHGWKRAKHDQISVKFWSSGEQNVR